MGMARSWERCTLRHRATRWRRRNSTGRSRCCIPSSSAAPSKDSTRCWREDATCGIAYWGIALSDWSNPFAPGVKDKSQLQAGRESAERGKTVGAKTERERAYLAAVGKLYSDYESTPQRTRLIAYRDAMGEVAAKYPGRP